MNKICYIFSPKLLNIFSSFSRNLFYNYHLHYIFPYGYKINKDYHNIPDDRIFFYKNDNELMKLITVYDNILTTETYDLKWYITDIDNQEKLNILIKDKKIYFLTHGITGVYGKEEKDYCLFKNWAYTINTKNIYIITICNIIYKILLNRLKKYEDYDNNREKLIKLNTLPQFSLELNRKLYPNSIVIFPTIHNTYYALLINEISNIIYKIYGKINIFIKCKSKLGLDEYRRGKGGEEHFIRTLGKNNKIKLINNKPITDFLHCKKIICLQGGTSYFEALTYNKHTFAIFTQENRHYNKIPLKFNKLLISNSINEFEKQLLLSDKDGYFDKEYDDEIKKLYQFQIGEDSLSKNTQETFDPLIENIIFNNEKTIDTLWNGLLLEKQKQFISSQQ